MIHIEPCKCSEKDEFGKCFSETLSLECAHQHWHNRGYSSTPEIDWQHWMWGTPTHIFLVWAVKHSKVHCLGLLLVANAWPEIHISNRNRHSRKNLQGSYLQHYRLDCMVQVDCLMGIVNTLGRFRVPLMRDTRKMTRIPEWIPNRYLIQSIQKQRQQPSPGMSQALREYQVPRQESEPQGFPCHYHQDISCTLQILSRWERLLGFIWLFPSMNTLVERFLW